MEFNGLPIKVLSILLITSHIQNTFCSKRAGDTVGYWADKFGNELWDVGSAITKISELKSSYQHANTEVEKKDPTNLLSEIVENLGKMLERKMDAIKCILQVAEDAAETYDFNTSSPMKPYYNAKESEANCTEIDYENENETSTYKNICLKPDPHFYNIPINTTHSVVHVPSNVVDQLNDSKFAIEWSEMLDEAFVQNYNSDPALSWQYFGSVSGVMRQYPAMKWNQVENDIYDCRTQSWFIEAATCSKDIVILLDHSGSMAGMPNHIAKLTVSNILDTFSNNDYVNIFNYSKTTEELVPCFKDTLVQATPENIMVFKDALKELPATGGYADLSMAFQKSFELLQTYREKRGCTGNETDCNQAIMLVTDGVPANLTEVFEKYNWFNNGSHIPVRIFTYLIGREVTKVREIQWMACLNRGYYSHVQSLEEVTEKVLNYIPVIARPLVLQGIERPISWTHAFADTRDLKVSTWLWDIMEHDHQKSRLDTHYQNKGFFYSREQEDDSYMQTWFKSETENKLKFQEYHLYTSVAIPAFDNKVNNNKTNNETRVANLLGVAGTDVPLEDFKKLSYPYKIGVNGYTFIVSNNGYVLMHPDLRPVFNGVLKNNYNSVDLVEIEQFDYDNGPREINHILLDLRSALVNGSEGSIHNVKIKYHYDEMRRVSKESYNFYYAPLVNTPFSIGLAIPEFSGENLIKVGDEIRKNMHTNIQITSFFQGINWKLHPKWVYCKYHYHENHHFDSKEEEFMHFLEKMAQSSWKWCSQYGASKNCSYTDNEVDSDEMNKDCNRKRLLPDAYYCDRDLVQRLVFDAKITKMEKWKFRNIESKKLFERYGANLRFIATMSGLTRWEYISEESGNTSGPDFGDVRPRAIDENWYKSAVLQHKYEPESFVYSVPFDAGEKNDDVVVTGSYAVYTKEAGNAVPASVVGYEMSHSRMYERFMNITNKNNCQGCIESCSDYEIDCYVIDHNGYVVISETMNDTGRFFGEIDGAVMETMLQEHIYEKVTIYDYQALCFKTVLVSSDSSILLTPFNYIKLAFNWFVSKLVWILIETNIRLPVIEAGGGGCMPEIPEEKLGPKGPKKLRKGQNQEEEAFFNQVKEPVYVDEPYPCEKQRDLYILQQHIFTHGHGYSDQVPTNCSRPFYIKKVPHSNLLLIVIKSLYPSCFIKLDGSPTDIIYANLNETNYPCHKLSLNTLPRRRLSGCFNEHPLEHEIKMCGTSEKITTNKMLLIATIAICLLNFYKIK